MSSLPSSAARRAQIAQHFARQRPKIDSEWYEVAERALDTIHQPPAQIICPDDRVRSQREVIEHLNLTSLALGR